MRLLDKPSTTLPPHAAESRVPALEHDRAAPLPRPMPLPWWRGLLSRGVALLLLIPGCPIMLLTALVVRLTSPGPGIYRQVRVGLGGRPFVMYKIRTMRHDAEARTGAVWAQHNDPRVTRVGRIIRGLHLDELPQLLNVLRGEMALVGPRPERPEFTQRLSREIPGYLDRLAVLPGITGLAQINLPPDTDLDSVRRKLVLDLEYVHHANLWLDLRILLCTSTRLFGMHTDIARRLLGLRRKPHAAPPPARPDVLTVAVEAGAAPSAA